MGIEIEIDGLLLARVRDEGDVDAFGCLYERHVGATRRFARSLCANDADADDLTAEVFTGLLASLRRGNGPTELALPYLFASVKHGHWRTTGRRAEETALARTARVGSATRDANDIVEAAVVRTALATLPDHVQVLLWSTEVADESLDDALERHGTSAHNLAVHRHRARRALGTAYLAQHVDPEGGSGDLDPECQATLGHLALLVRNKIGVRRRRRIEKHLAICSHCCRTRERLELINTRLRAHPGLPWGVWSAGLTATIKTQVSTWIGASTVTLASSSVLAVAVLAPAPDLVERTAVHNASVVATHTSFERVDPAATVTDIGAIGRAGPTAAPSDAPAGSGSWYELPISADQPPAPATNETADPIHVVTTSDAPQTGAATSPAAERDETLGAAAPPAAVAATGDRVPRPFAGAAAVGPAPDDDEAGSGAAGGDAGGLAKGDDNGKGSVQRETDGNQHGQDDGTGQHAASDHLTGSGNASGPGASSGQGNANGPGASSGQDNGNANGPGASNGNGLGLGTSSGQGNANANGPGASSGQGNGSGSANGPGTSNGNVLAKGRERRTIDDVDDEVALAVEEIVASESTGG